MENTLVPLLSGLIGVLLGSLTSIITIYIQSKNENKRALTKNAVELALEDYRITTEHAKKHGSTVFPMTLYIHFYIRIMEYADKNRLSKENLEKIIIERDELIKIILNDNKKDDQGT